MYHLFISPAKDTMLLLKVTRCIFLSTAAKKHVTLSINFHKLAQHMAMLWTYAANTREDRNLMTL